MDSAETPCPFETPYPSQTRSPAERSSSCAVGWTLPICRSQASVAASCTDHLPSAQWPVDRPQRGDVFSRWQWQQWWWSGTWPGLGNLPMLASNSCTYISTKKNTQKLQLKSTKLEGLNSMLKPIGDCHQTPGLCTRKTTTRVWLVRISSVRGSPIGTYGYIGMYRYIGTYGEALDSTLTT